MAEGAQAVGSLDHVSDDAWATAQARFRAIEPLLGRPDRRRGEVEAAGAAVSVTAASVYGWIKRFESSRHVSSLLPGRSGRRHGNTQLSAEMEDLIRALIEQHYLTDQKKSPQAVINAVESHCRRVKIPAPGPNTIRRRIRDLDEAKTLRRRGMKDQARKLEPLRGSFPPTTRPLECVLIAHTPADIEVVTDDRLQVLGRPWITLAIDAFTRMVVGYWLDMERPSAFTVGQVVCTAILPKHELLASLNVQGEWPVWGMPEKIHCDNAGEFDSRTFDRALSEHGINLEFRPVATPHWGGYIERLYGTVNKATHKLPGTTFSNPMQRGEYDSGKKAVLTLDEFETWLVDFIVNRYHQGKHGGIDLPPIAKWRDAIQGTENTPAMGLVPLVADTRRLRVDFLPFTELTVQRYGLQWDLVRYYTPALQRWIDAKDPKTGKPRRFVIRRDPRKISPVWFLDPNTNDYMEVPFANPGLPVISLYELRHVNREAKARGEKLTDYARMEEAIQREQQLIDEATEKTKEARKEHRRTRRKRAENQTPSDPTTLRTPRPAAPPSAAPDIYAEPVALPDVIDITSYD